MTTAKTYRATGINLKGSPLGEADLLLTILTAEHGLLRAVAPGARKPKSKIGGRTGLFVVNQLSLGRGRSLDRIHQAEVIASYPRLSEDLGKLTAGQYLAEMALHQALSDQPQVELFGALTGAIAAVEAVEAVNVAGGGAERAAAVMAALSRGIYGLLAIAGVTPQLFDCALSQVPLLPPDALGDRDRWRVGFSAAAGGVVSLEALAQVDGRALLAAHPAIAPAAWSRDRSRGQSGPAPPSAPPPLPGQLMPLRLDAMELAALRSLVQPEEPPPFSLATWVRVERSLRHYTQYHFGKPIRSAALLDTYVRC
ncbi:MAG: DNA repair protein RecO [Cyanophyceae cyanobacterium]